MDSSPIYGASASAVRVFVLLLCPPTKGEGGHIGFSADPVGVGVRVGVGVTESCTHVIS